MSFNKWPKRSAEKNYSMVPNEIFSIGLDFHEISIYSYLLWCENRKTYQCYPSYKTIGHTIGMSENTVAKYVRPLRQVEEIAARYHAAQLLEKYNDQSRQNTPCAPFQKEASPRRPAQAVTGVRTKISGFMESATAKPEPEPPDPPEESRCKVIPFEKVG